MLYFQVLATIFILFAIQRIVSRYQDARIPRSEVWVWIIFWVIIGIAVWYPQGTDKLANLLGISRGYELVVASSLALIFYLMFKVFSHVHQLQGQLTDLVREIAVKNHEQISPEKHENS